MNLGISVSEKGRELFLRMYAHVHVGACYYVKLYICEGMLRWGLSLNPLSFLAKIWGVYIP